MSQRILPGIGGVSVINTSRKLAALATGAAVAVAAGVSLFSAGVPVAQASVTARDAAAARSGWSVSKLFAPGASGNVNLQGIATAGRSAAWAVGSNDSGLFVARWNGRSWQQLAVPSAFTTGTSAVNDSAVAASSASNMWTLPMVGSTQYALHWNGAKWTSYKLSSEVAGLTIVTGSDLWAFGDGDAYQFNGRSWRKAPSPGLFDPHVTAFAADDVWAVGDTAASINSSSPVTRVAQWDGKHWHVIRTVPKLRLSGKATIIQGADVVKPTDIWAVEAFPVDRCGCEPPPAGLFVEQWNGHQWKTVLKDTADYGQGFVPDGPEAIWGILLHVASGKDMLFRYAGGKLRRVSAPAKFTLSPFVAAIPGSDAVWVVGDTPGTSAASFSAAILRYTL